MCLPPSDPRDPAEPVEACPPEASCPVCDGRPRVLVAIAHPTLRRLTCQLLAREHGCWEALELGPQETVSASVTRLRPDLLVIDRGRFPAWCDDGSSEFDPGQVVVVDPEPTNDYRTSALADRAGGWVASETIAEALSLEMRRVLGCRHAPCPVHTREANDEVASPASDADSRHPQVARTGSTRG